MKFFKNNGKKVKSVKAPDPRGAQEISQEYTNLCSKLGHAQYQVKFNQEVTEHILARLIELDREGTARNQLDAAAKAAETTKQEEASNVQP